MQHILQHYNLPNTCTIQPINNGLINNTYKIIAPNNLAYILQKINTNVFTNPYAIENNINNIGTYLQNNQPQYLFTQPLALPNGKQLLHLNNNYYRLYTFVQNSVSISSVLNKIQAYQAALQFGNFTALLNNFNVATLQTTIPNFHNLSLRFQQFKASLLQGNKQRIQTCTHEIAYITSQQHIVQKFEAIQKNPNFKLRVTHHDTKISNVLFNAQATPTNQKALCIIDLDTLMPGYFISDLGDMFRTYICPINEDEKDITKITINKVYYNAVLQGYLKNMQYILTNAEKEQLHYAGEFMIYMQALRFLTDYFNNDVYYGAQYQNHNLNRAKNQLQLLKKFKEIVGG